MYLIYKANKDGFISDKSSSSIYNNFFKLRLYFVDHSLAFIFSATRKVKLLYKSIFSMSGKSLAFGNHQAFLNFFLTQF